MITMGRSYSPNTKKSTERKISCNKTCGKTMTDMGRQHWEGLLAAQYKMEETSRGYEYLEEDY
jgi:hypothetical protein